MNFVPKKFYFLSETIIIFDVFLIIFIQKYKFKHELIESKEKKNDIEHFL